jgi:hypothetical protein
MLTERRTGRQALRKTLELSLNKQCSFACRRVMKKDSLSEKQLLFISSIITLELCPKWWQTPPIVHGHSPASSYPTLRINL